MTESIAPVLGRIASGLFVLTIRHGDVDSGMLASWVMQAGFEPPTVSVAVRRDRYIADWLSAGSPFVLHILPTSDKKLLKHFSRGFEPGDPALEGLEFARSAHGVAVLKGTVGHLECTAVGHADSGDHRVFLAHVNDGKLDGEDSPAVHLRKNGLRY
jgi:flavin reductase (DIM6/NTAB) family NADH-FMN oxidoreductase RutF